MKELKYFSKLQEGFKEIVKFIKSEKTRLNETKLVFYDEIETLRIKYEHGRLAARKYQER